MVILSNAVVANRRYDESVDIYALGCVVYEVAKLERTFEASNMPAVVTKIVENRRSPIGKPYSNSLQHVVDQCLAANANARPSAGELLSSDAFARSDMNTSAMRKKVDRLSHEAHLLVNRPSSVASNGSLTSLQAELLSARSDMSSSRYSSETQLYFWGAGASRPRVHDFFVDNRSIVPTRIAAGEAHLAVVSLEAGLYTWNSAGLGEADGYSFGQLGHGDKSSCRKPTRVQALASENILDVGCGDDFTMCVTATGNLYVWGSNEYGILAVDPDTSQSDHSAVPLPIELDPGVAVRQIDCGSLHVAVLSQAGDVFSWGCGGFGRLGLGDEDDRYSPQAVQLRGSPRVVQVSAGHEGTLFLTDSGAVQGTGNNYDNQLGLNKASTLVHYRRALAHNNSDAIEGGGPGVILSSSIPLPAFSLRDKRRIFRWVSCGKRHSGAIDTAGKLYLFGDNTKGQLGTGDFQQVRGMHKVKYQLEAEDVISVACGISNTVAVTASNAVFTWGKAEHGMLGVQLSGDTKKGCIPRRLETDFHTVQQLCCSALQTFAISEQLTEAHSISHFDSKGESDASVFQSPPIAQAQSVSLVANSGSEDDTDDMADMPWLLKELNESEFIPMTEKQKRTLCPNEEDCELEQSPWLLKELQDSEYIPLDPILRVDQTEATTSAVSNEDMSDLDNMPWLKRELEECEVIPVRTNIDADDEDDTDELQNSPWLVEELRTSQYIPLHTQIRSSRQQCDELQSDPASVVEETKVSKGMNVHNDSLAGDTTYCDADLVPPRTHIEHSANTIIPDLKISSGTEAEKDSTNEDLHNQMNALKIICSEQAALLAEQTKRLTSLENIVQRQAGLLATLEHRWSLADGFNPQKNMKSAKGSESYPMIDGMANLRRENLGMDLPSATSQGTQQIDGSRLNYKESSIGVDGGKNRRTSYSLSHGRTSTPPLRSPTTSVSRRTPTSPRTSPIGRTYAYTKSWRDLQ